MSAAHNKRKENKNEKTLLPLSFVLSSVLLAGCALLNTQNFSPPEQIAKREANMSSAIFADDGITTIKIPNLKMDSDTQNDTFPKAKIPTFDITESGLVPALSKIAKRAGITLTIKGSFSDALSASATIENLGGDIQNVLDKLASTYGFWYEYKKNSLTIYPQKKFTVELPAAIYTDLFAGMANTISTIGAQDISLDRNNRTVTYTANRTVQTEIEKYFKHVEATRTIIAYDVVIYRVELNNADQTGIKWNQLQYTEPAFKVGLSGGFADSIPGAGAVQNTPQFWGAPVANSAALSALDSSSLYDGQVRINKADNTLWRWNSSLAQWQTVTGGQWTTIGTALSYTTGNVLIGTNTDNGIDKLQVNGTVVSNGYRINGYGTVVDASGNWVGQTIPISKGGTGLTALGLPGQILGVNNAGSGLNYRTLAGTTNQISIAISNTQITFSLPQDIAPTSSPTFAGLTLNGQLNANAGIATTTLTASGLIAGQRYNALGGSVTADYPLFAGSQTWNNAGVSFNGIKLNITDTASTVSSSLMDLQVNNVSRFRIAKDGSVYAANIGVSSASLPANGIFAPSANTLGFAAGSTIVASADVTGIDIKSGGLKINGVVVIDSAKNISTTGSVTANGGYKVGATTVIDSGGYLIAANTVTAGTDCTTVGVGGIAKDANGDLYICK